METNIKTDVSELHPIIEARETWSHRQCIIHRFRAEKLQQRDPAALPKLGK